MAYLANLLPPAVRFIGANNNLIKPGGDGLLARQAEAAIRLHAGSLYGLEDPANHPKPRPGHWPIIDCGVASVRRSNRTSTTTPFISAACGPIQAEFPSLCRHSQRSLASFPH